MLQVMTEFYLYLHYVMGITAVWRARSSWECPARSNQCGLDQDPGLNGCPMINSHLACRSAKLVCEPVHWDKSQGLCLSIRYGAFESGHSGNFSPS